MAETPSSQQHAGDTPPEESHLRHSSALAHRAVAETARGRGNHRRSSGRASHTPRDPRNGDRRSRPGTLPPVPGRLSSARLLAPFLALAVAVLGLVLLTWQVAGDGPLLSVDDGARDVVADARGSRAGARVEPVAQFFADLGGTAVAGPVLAAAALYAAWWHRRAGAARWWLPLVWAAVVGAAVPALVVPFKALVARPGPGGEELEPGRLGYFPSGHTVTAAVCFGAAALLLPHGRVAAGWAAGVLSAAVGPALVWCGYHWALDVVGGWCLAGIVLVPLGAAAARTAPRPADAAQQDSGRDGAGSGGAARAASEHAPTEQAP